MALKIQQTGLEQYAPGGQARLKIMLIGGPGAGKTRLSSYWPSPIYADCEAGLASIADRKMPFVNIRNSNDMLEFLTEMRLESGRPYDGRRFKTVVIDTLDAFQRKVMDEWLLANPGAGSFRGYDAWGYLDAKMNMLLTRLLNLDMNVIVNCHYTDKTIKEGVGDSASERQELQLQLSGAIKDRVFNDFDLVGWMGKYYEAVDGQRVEKRGLTFKSDERRPFLKDRLFVTPEWMEVRFADSDYETLFSAFTARMDEFAPTEEIGEITSLTPEGAGDTGITFGGVAGGPVAPINPSEIPLSQFDKPTLAKIARDEGITTMPDGQPIRGNTLKGELVAAIEHGRAQKANTPAAEAAVVPTEVVPVSAPVQEAPAAAPGEVAAEPNPTVAPSESAAFPAATSDPVSPSPSPETGVGTDSEVVLAHGASDALVASAPAATPVADHEAPVAVPTLVQAAPVVATSAAAELAVAAPANEPTLVQTAPVVDTPDAGPVNPQTGEMLGATEQQALATLKEVVGGEVISVDKRAETPPVAPLTSAPAPAVASVPAPAAAARASCEDCGKDLSAENQDYVKLAFIKFRKKLCNEHYLAAKKAS